MSLNMASCSTEAIYLPYLQVLTGLSNTFFPTKLQLEQGQEPRVNLWCGLLHMNNKPSRSHCLYITFC